MELTYLDFKLMGRQQPDYPPITANSARYAVIRSASTASPYATLPSWAKQIQQPQVSLSDEYEKPEWSLSDAELSAAHRVGGTNYDQQRIAVDGVAKRHGVDSVLICAIIETESNWRPNAL